MVLVMNEGSLAKKIEKASRWAGRAGTNPSAPLRFKTKRRIEKKAKAALDRLTDIYGYAMDKGWVPF